MASDTEEAAQGQSKKANLKRKQKKFLKGLGCETTFIPDNPYETVKSITESLATHDERMKDESDLTLLQGILEDLPAYKSLMASDESDNPYGLDLITLHAIRMILQESKDAGYSKSWAKYGEGGVWLNAARKIDRLRTLALLVLSRDDRVIEENRVSLVDTLVDLANYADMWTSYIAKIRPEDFKRWLISRWCPATGEDAETILETLRNVGTKI